MALVLIRFHVKSSLVMSQLIGLQATTSQFCLPLSPSHREVRISENVINISVSRHGVTSNVFRRLRYKSCFVLELSKFLIHLDSRSGYFGGRLYELVDFQTRSQNCEKRPLASCLYVRSSVCPHGTTRLPLDGSS